MRQSLNTHYQGRVPVNMMQKLERTTAEEMAANINNAFHEQGIKHLRPVSGKSLMQINADCFDKKTHCLTEEGKKYFNKVNAQLDISSKSTMAEYYRAIRIYINKFVHEGKVTRFFDIIK